MSIEEYAQVLYESSIWSAPTWDLLGDVTRSVWIERATVALYGDLA